jgi:phosphatidylserine synthase
MRGVWDALCLMFFVACGISRLARYNVTAASLAAATGWLAMMAGEQRAREGSIRHRRWSNVARATHNTGVVFVIILLTQVYTPLGSSCLSDTHC